MNFKGVHILVLEGYARQTLPYMRVFKQEGCEVTVLCNSKLDCAYASRLPDHKIIGICDVHRPIESEKYIVDLIKTGRYDMVLPIVDFTAGMLAKHKKELSKYAKLATNDANVFDYIDDKLNVMKVCTENSIPCPMTLFEIKSIDQILSSGLQFPVVMKPRNGFGSKGFARLETPEELIKHVNERKINLDEMVVQECIPNDGLVMCENIFVDNEGIIKSQFSYGCAHVFPIKGGSGTYNFSFDREDIHKQCAKLIQLVNARGCVGIDLIIDPRDNIAKVLEINPRICAGAVVGVLAGINQPLQLLQKEFGDTVTEFKSYKSNVNVRMMQTDLLWFLKSPKRFSTKPSFFTQAHEQIFYWDDPLPWFSFLIRGILNFTTEMRERS